jgi:DNA-binding response OmpR family regulator
VKRVLLLVPDDVLSGEIRESFLDRGSFTVRTAGDASEALSMISVWRPSLIVFRSDLAGMSISEFCRMVRDQVRVEETKLLMVTDQVGAALEDVDQVGYDAHLISPVEAPQLLHTVATLVDVRERRAPRVPLEALVRTEGLRESADSPDTSLANAVNISENGILLESEGPLKVGSKGRLHFFLPGGAERITVSGIVRTLMDEVRLHYSVEFVDLPDHHLETIRRYVQENLSE